MPLETLLLSLWMYASFINIQVCLVLRYSNVFSSQQKVNLKMHTLPTNQLRPPASITDMTAF